VRIRIIWATANPAGAALNEEFVMNALLVGADRLGNIPDVLGEFGIRIASHISGRQPGHQRRALVPAGIQVVILFTDFLGHNVMRTFREQARAQGLPVLCSRRSTSSLRQAIGASLAAR